MTTRTSAPRKASARIEALDGRSMFSGEIDHAFGTGGLASVPGGTLNTGAYYGGMHPVVAVQQDGKILVVGSLKAKSSTAVVYRYLANGAIDKSFGMNGVTTIPNVNASRINGVGVLPDGRILIEGQTYVRLTAAGKTDATFGGGDGIAPSILAADRRNTGPNAEAVLADGSFYELSAAHGGQARLYKYKADGTVDRSFGSGGSFNLAALSTGHVDATGGVVADAGGRLYVTFSDQVPNAGFDYASALRAVRLTAAGKVDTTYGTAGLYAESTDAADPFAYLAEPVALAGDGRLFFQSGVSTDHFSDQFVDALSADGKTIASTVIPRDFRAVGLVATKDGSAYVTGTSNDQYDESADFLEGQDYASVLHLKKDLTVDTTFSADRDGVAGFRTGGGVSGYGGGLTPSGDFVLLGGEEVGTGLGLVRIDGPTKITRVTYVLSGDKLVVNGSASNDSIVASAGPPDNSYDAYAFDHALVVFLDSSSKLVSRDRLLIDDTYNATTQEYEPAIKTLVFDLNGGDDVFVGALLKQGVYVNGGGGNDSIVGSASADTLYGGDGTDTLVANGGADKNTQ